MRVRLTLTVYREDGSEDSGEVWEKEIPFHNFQFLQDWLTAFFGERGSIWPS